jgi:hypothetical protein
MVSLIIGKVTSKNDGINPYFPQKSKGLIASQNLKDIDTS